MADLPVIKQAEAGKKSKASDYNTNFTNMVNYVEASVGEMQTYVSGFMPSVTSQAGKFLTNNGTTASWSYPVPAGIIAYFGANSAPAGWLVCDGSAVSRTTYADLFSAIGTTFGAGDESTTFNLPDLVGDYPFIEGSTTVGTQTAAGLPNITGTFKQRGGNASASGAFYLSGSSNTANYDSGSTNSSFAFNASRSSAIYGNSSTVQPASTTLLPIIKY